MKKAVTDAEVDRRVTEQMAGMIARGRRPLPPETMRALARMHLARMHLEMTAPYAPAHQKLTKVPRPAPIAAPKPAPRPAPVKPVAPPSAAVLADRDRAQEIIAMTLTGAEAEAAEAVRTGMSVEAFEGVLAARAILEARRRAGG